MSVLAAYIGAHDVTGLIYKSPSEYSFWSSPYVYSPELFSAFVSETSYYRFLFDQMCKEQGLKLTDCDVILSGFLQPPRLDLGLKLYVSLPELISKVESFYPVMVNNYAIVTKDQMFSKKSLETTYTSMPNLVDDDFYSNLTLYPNVVASDIVSRVDMDNRLLDAIKDLKLPKDVPLVFFGSRFNSLHNIEDVNTMFILQMLQGLGIHEIYIDSFDVTILSKLLQMFLGRDPCISNHPEKLGVVISQPSTMECLITSQIGTSQIIDLEKDKIFVLPIAPDERTKVMLKSSGLSQQEKILSGGKLGLLFDTRSVKTTFTDAYKQYNSSLKNSGGEIK